MFAAHFPMDTTDVDSPKPTYSTLIAGLGSSHGDRLSPWVRSDTCPPEQKSYPISDEQSRCNV